MGKILPSSISDAEPHLHHHNQEMKCDICQTLSCKCKEKNGDFLDNHVEAKKVETVVVVNGGYEHEQHGKANSSFLHSVLNTSGVLIGLGQLSTSYAVQRGGWVSSFLLIGFGIICAYTAHLLAECLRKHPKLRNYTDIAYHAFGKKGRTITIIFIYMEAFMALVSYTISLNDNLGEVFSRANFRVSGVYLSTTHLLTIIAILLALPTVWLRDLSKISFLSTAGILMSLLIFIAVGCTAAFGGVKPNQPIPVLQIRNVPAVSGLYIFSFSSHVVFPDIYKSMKDPSKFTTVSIVSFGLVTTFYTALGFMGAKLFGPQVNSQITLSMPRHLVVTKIALWATVLTPLTKYAFELVPIAVLLEDKFPSSMSSKMRMLIRGSVGSSLLILVLVLALTVPYFEQVLGLTGSLVSMCASIVYPCAFYTKIFWSKSSKAFLGFNVTLIILGSLLGVLGTISSSKSLVENLRRK